MWRAALFMVVALWFPAAIRPPAATAASASGDTYHLDLPKDSVAAGESVTLRLVPSVPDGALVHWGATVGAAEVGLPDGVYRAPYVIPPGTPPARVTATFVVSGVMTTVSFEIELQPGAVAGAEDCLGPGQSFSTALGDVESTSMEINRLPELVHLEAPVYRRYAFKHASGDTIPIRALVCRSGRVLDAYVVQTFIWVQGPHLVEHDPERVQAALAAVRKYVFTPARDSRHAVASWVLTKVVFPS